MRTLWNEADRRELIARIDKLSPQAKARWGKMNAPQMLVHIADAFRMSLGEIHVRFRKTPLRFTAVKLFVIYVLPFIPKGAPTAPELQKSQPAGWREDVAQLRALMDRLVAARNRPASGWPPHPTFGPLSERAWGVLNYKHLDHHLKQFGG